MSKAVAHLTAAVISLKKYKFANTLRANTLGLFVYVFIWPREHRPQSLTIMSKCKKINKILQY